MQNYELYVVDTETTGLDPIKSDIIELSMIRFNTGEQKTWLIKPCSFEHISPDSLRINKHKLEDITHKTEYGKSTYLDPNVVIVEVENWLLEHGASTNSTVLVGQNVSFDINMMLSLWKKCNSETTWPFGHHSIDTKSLAFVFDMVQNKYKDYYNLASLVKEAGIKFEKGKLHSAKEDTLVTLELFKYQLKVLEKIK
jgi:DNA polymerase III epsilon subunit-like protein